MFLVAHGCSTMREMSAPSIRGLGRSVLSVLAPIQRVGLYRGNW